MVSKKLSSLQHPFVKYVVSLRKDKALRSKENQVFVMGTKIVKELFEANAPIQTLIVQEDTSFPCQVEETFSVSFDILKKMTGIPHPEPVAAIVAAPIFQDLSKASRILVLDNLSDPGNVGTLLRTALALGWDGAYLIEGTCDPLNEKALRAAKGATFRLPLTQGSWQDFLSFAKKNSFHVLVADIEGSNLEKQKATPPLALILSHESQGARKEATELFSKVTIPMSGHMESLNVASAGAILLHGLKS